MKQHTKGRLLALPLEDDDYYCQITTVSGDPYPLPIADVYTEEDARRLAAAWNAFDGVPTDDIEKLDAKGLALVGGFIEQLSAQRDELLKALLTARDHIDMDALEISHCKDAECISAAIAKVES